MGNSHRMANISVLTFFLNAPCSHQIQDFAYGTLGAGREKPQLYGKDFFRTRVDTNIFSIASIGMRLSFPGISRVSAKESEKKYFHRFY